MPAIVWQIFFLFIIFIASACGCVPYRFKHVLRQCVVFGLAQFNEAISLPSTETMKKMTGITTKCYMYMLSEDCYFVETCRFPPRKYYFQSHTNRDETRWKENDRDRIKYDLITVNCVQPLNRTHSFSWSCCVHIRSPARNMKYGITSSHRTQHNRCQETKCNI